MSDKKLYGRLIMPALRFDKNEFQSEKEKAYRLLEEIEPCGFIIFGGDADNVSLLTRELNKRAGRKLLFAADLEFGAGQQFSGLTRIPSAAAIAASQNSKSLACLAGRLTAVEAGSVGINVIFAPVCDVNSEPKNPIINVRSFGSVPDEVSELVESWIHGAQAAGAIACAKHFPGHGNVTTDSHSELPVVSENREDIYSNHLIPFRTAIDAGVKSIMSAHISVPALDESGIPATLSSKIIGEILRKDMRYDGLVFTDALIMSGIGVSEEEAAVRAISAGCDILLYPSEPVRILDALINSGINIEESLRRIDSVFSPDIVDIICKEAPTLIKGTVFKPKSFVILSDDSRLNPEPFRRRAVECGWIELNDLSQSVSSETICAVYAMPGAWRGRCGPSTEVISRIPTDIGVVSFGDPYFLFELDVSYAVAAYDAHHLIQENVVNILNSSLQFNGKFPLTR